MSLRRRAGLAGAIWLASLGVAFAQSDTLLPPIIPQISPDAPVVNPCRLVQSTLGGQIVTNCMTGLGGGGGGGVTSVGQTFTGGLVSVSGSPVTTSGTLALSVVGTSGGIPYFNSAASWASSASLMAGALVIGGGPGGPPNSTTTGAGVLTALGVGTGSAGAFVVNGGALGTPSSGILTSATGLPISTGVNGLGTGVSTALGHTVLTSASFTPQNGAIASGDCLQWTSSGVTDAGAPCGSGGGGSLSVTDGTTTIGGVTQIAFPAGSVSGTTPSAIVNVSGGGGVADNSAFTYGTSDMTAIGGVYNSSITPITSGSQGALALTADRNAFVNVNRWVGTQLGAPSNYGTSPGAVTVPGVNAFVTNTPPVSQSGTWTVQPGNTANSTPWLVAGAGTAGSAASGVVSVQGVASMTPVQVSQATAGNLNATVSPASGDPCATTTHHFVSINQTTSAQLFAGTSSEKTYICSINLVVAGTENMALVEGTGSVCATNIAGLAGGTTAATGWNLVANGGLVIAGGGHTALGPPDSDSHATAANVCLLESGSDQVSGQVQYVQK